MTKTPLLSFFWFLFLCITLHAAASLSRYADHNHHRDDVGPTLVRRDERTPLVSTEYGEISAVNAGGDGAQQYNLQFITLEPNALFLPVLLHADMVFYVHSGEGRLSWVDEDDMRRVKLTRGDVYRLRPGSIFYVQSNLETERHKLRLYAIFTNPFDNLHGSSMGAYSSIYDLILGFDKKTLQAAFQVPAEMIEELTSGTRQPPIVRAPTTEKKEKTFWEIDSQFLRAVLGRKGYDVFDVNKKKSKTKAFNIFDHKPDFENDYGRSSIVTKKHFPALKGPNLSLFLVNLTEGSMMGPHWNPMASEISIVSRGQGMIRVIGSTTKNKSHSKNTRFKVGEGDVFLVPRFHPMAQMAFTNDSFVFMGFSTTTKKNHPQFLAGKASVLRTLDKEIVAASFGFTNTTTIDRLLDQQGESVILECESCAEEEFRKLEEEVEREREEEEAKRQEEEEGRRRREEEEERRRREEEERRRKEEEARKREEEERRRQEEEQIKRREEEARRRKEEEARREEEEAKRQEEERRRREEEERARREEEEARTQEEEERARKEEARRQEEERKRREEEETRRREEEEEEETRRREKEKEKRREGEEKRREREEAARREEEEARRQEEEAARREQEEEEEEAKRREREREEEEEEEEGEAREEEEEEARRREEERAREETRREQEEEREGKGDEKWKRRRKVVVLRPSNERTHV